MKCLEVQQSLGEFWDLPEDDAERQAIEEHLQACADCREEFRLWEESEQLIRSFSEYDEEAAPIDHINQGVMDRIYEEESWLMPVASRSYQFTRKFRRNLAAVIAGCMAIFISGLYYFLTGTSEEASVKKMTGLLETANASSDVSMFTNDFYADVPVASISDPIVLNVVPTIPQYWIALSLLGIVMTLLILNWLSRTKH